MEVEKKRSKGAFLQLFDWNSKSKKKLFSSDPDVSALGGAKQVRDDAELLVKSGLQMNVMDESGTSSSRKGSSEWNCASSETSAEGYVTRAPGVVARLMGLDSLPKSSIPESSTSFSAFYEPNGSCHNRGTYNLQGQYDPMDYLSSSNRLDSFSSRPAEVKRCKTQNRPIERFQIETLPPKSAKPISITHNRLLSPIKTPGFTPTQNATYIMEAAAKIIEASPRAVRGQVSSAVSASVPLRIQDLKIKLESACEASKHQKTIGSSAVKHVKGKSDDKKYNVVVDAQPSRNTMASGKCNTGNWRSNGKSLSLAQQAKMNVQTRDVKNQISNRNVVAKKEQHEGNLSLISKSQPSEQKSSQRKTSTNGTNMALKQNNLKQNSIYDRNGSVSRATVSKQQAERTRSVNFSPGVSKTLSKGVVKAESGLATTLSVHGPKELNSSRVKIPGQKKDSANLNITRKRIVATNVLTNCDDMPSKCSTINDGRPNWGMDSNKKGMDVISFTFTSPIKRCSVEVQACGQVCEDTGFGSASSGDRGPPNFKDSSSSSPVGSITDGNFLSALLEQKLKELTDRIESSNCDIDKEVHLPTSQLGLQESVSILDMIMKREESIHQGLHKSMKSPSEFGSSSADGSIINSKQVWQVVASEELEEFSSSATSCGNGKEIDYEQQSQASTLDSSFVSRSHVDGMVTCGGNMGYSSTQAPEVLEWLSAREFQTMGAEDEISSALSTLITESDVNQAAQGGSCSLFCGGARNWELKYVEEVIGNIEEMLEKVLVNEPGKFIFSSLFDKLENQVERTDINKEHLKLKRKLLFDCTSECLELRLRTILPGTCKAWNRLHKLFQNKHQLAKDVYKVISGSKSIDDLMVDVLVDHDMSTGDGKWVDFRVEVFEEGIEVGQGILTSLIDELVADFT